MRDAYRWWTTLALIFFAFSPAAGWACASCGCTLSSDWQNATQPGLRLDLRYDYVNQNQLWAGTSAISPGAASSKISNGNPQEVELYTRNSYYTANLEYTFNQDWRASVVVPYISRKHSTLGTASNGETPGASGGQYDSDIAGTGDVKVMGRYQGFSPQHNFGIVFGVKLPTGSYTETGNSTDPAAPDPVGVDRGLQLGTGTTDVLLGPSFNDAFDKNWDYFGEAIYQFALNARSGYKPGNGLNLNLGIRYMKFSDYVSPQIQLNARYVEHDTGVNADTGNTGGTLVYLSPGLFVPVSTQVALYAFAQAPIYQNILGVQLVPMTTYSVGARYIF